MHAYDGRERRASTRRALQNVPGIPESRRAVVATTRRRAGTFPFPCLLSHMSTRTAQDHVRPQARRTQACASSVSPPASCCPPSPQLPLQLHHPVTPCCRRRSSCIYIVCGRRAAGSGAATATSWWCQGPAASGDKARQPPFESYSKQHIKNIALCYTTHASGQSLMHACILFEPGIWLCVHGAPLMIDTPRATVFGVSSSLHEIHAAVYQQFMLLFSCAVLRHV